MNETIPAWDARTEAVRLGATPRRMSWILPTARLLFSTLVELQRLASVVRRPTSRSRLVGGVFGSMRASSRLPGWDRLRSGRSSSVGEWELSLLVSRQRNAQLPAWVYARR